MRNSEMDLMICGLLLCLGHGAYGIVEKMRHRQTNTVMAVKRITATVNTQEQVSISQMVPFSPKSIV